MSLRSFLTRWAALAGLFLLACSQPGPKPCPPSKPLPEYDPVPFAGMRSLAEMQRKMGHGAKYLGRNGQLYYSLHDSIDLLLNDDGILFIGNLGYVLSWTDSYRGDFYYMLFDGDTIGYTKRGELDGIWQAMRAHWTGEIEDSAMRVRMGLPRYRREGEEPEFRLLSLRDSAFTDSVVRALRHYPPAFYRRPELLLQKAIFLSHLGFVEEEMLFYDTIIAHFPQDPRAYLWRATTLYPRPARREAARRDFRTYLRLMREQHLPFIYETEESIVYRINNEPLAD